MLLRGPKLLWPADQPFVVVREKQFMLTQSSEHHLQYLPIGSYAVLVLLCFITAATYVELSELQWWNWIAWTVVLWLWPRFSHLALTFFYTRLLRCFSALLLIPALKPAPTGSFILLWVCYYTKAPFHKEMCIAGAYWHWLLLRADFSLFELCFCKCHFVQLLFLPSTGLVAFFFVIQFLKTCKIALRWLIVTTPAFILLYVYILTAF